jgi:hypothetical protein
LAAFKAKIADAQGKLDNYNGRLSEVDAALNDVVLGEKEVDDLNARMLAGVAVKFGRDSNECEMSGGTGLSECKPPRRNGNGNTQQQ